MAIFQGMDLPEGKTPWAVRSGHCGNKDDGFRVYLTRDQYNSQMRAPSSMWVCPHGIQAHWDDGWYDDWTDRVLELNQGEVER